MKREECFRSHMGVWAIASDWMAQAVAQARGGTLRERFVSPLTDLELRAQVEAEYLAAGASKVVFDGNRPLYQIVQGVAVMGIDGPLAKFDSKYGGTNTIRTRQALRAAANDSDVASILMRIDSPGGSVAGTQELGADVAAASAQKNVVAFIEDMGASAAYWVASQARKIYANQMALVGSIGVYSVVFDSSKAAEMQGVQVHVISTAPAKGAFTAGAPITPDQLQSAQQIVDAFGKEFYRAVQAGREMTASQLAAVNTGEIWIAQQAKVLGLIDGVKTLDEVLQSMMASANKSAGGKASATAALEIEAAS